MIAQIEKLAFQQTTMADSLRSLQEGLRSDVTYIKSKVSDMELQLLDLRIQVNQKVGGEELTTIIDKKMQKLQDYRRDTDFANQRVADIAQQMRQTLQGVSPRDSH